MKLVVHISYLVPQPLSIQTFLLPSLSINIFLFLLFKHPSKRLHHFVCFSILLDLLKMFVVDLLASEWECEKREHQKYTFEIRQCTYYALARAAAHCDNGVWCRCVLWLLLFVFCLFVCALLFFEWNSPCKKHKSFFLAWRVNLSVFLSAWMNEPFSDDRWMLYNNLMNCHELHLACCCYCYATVFFSRLWNAATCFQASTEEKREEGKNIHNKTQLKIEFMHIHHVRHIF